MSHHEIIFRPITANDFTTVAAIYKQGINTGNATFQQEIPTWEEWDKGHIKDCRLIAIADNKIAGWAALSAVLGRAVYAGVAEVSIYIASDFRGQKMHYAA